MDGCQCTTSIALLCLLSQICGTTAFFDYSDGQQLRMEPHNIARFVGETLAINCTWPNMEPYGKYLYFVRMYNQIEFDIPQSQHHLVSDNTMQLRLENITTSDSGRYWCYIDTTGNRNSTEVSDESTDVQIDELPDKVENITAVLHNFEDMTVTWCMDPHAKRFNYTLHWKHHETEKICTMPKGQLCIRCHFCGSNAAHKKLCLGKEKIFFQYFEYKIQLKADGRRVKEFVFSTNKSLVRAGAVESLKVNAKNSTSLDLSWRVPFAMKSYETLITYEILYTDQVKNATKVQNTTNTSVVLTGLQPFTSYDITVRIIFHDSIYKGNASTVVAQTLADRPSRGAKFIGFRDVDCVGSAKECRTLFVYWKIDPSDINGGLASIKMFVNGMPVEEEVDTAMSSHKFEGLDARKDINISIYYVNEIGMSPTTWILVPPKGDDMFVNGYAEKDGNNGAITFHWLLAKEDDISIVGCDSPDQDRMCKSIWVKPMNTSAVNYTLENYGGNEKFALVTAEETRSDVYKLPRNWMCVFDAKKAPSQPSIEVDDNHKWVCIEEPNCDKSAGRPVEYIVYMGEEECPLDEYARIGRGCRELTGLEYGRLYQVCVVAVGHGNSEPQKVNFTFEKDNDVPLYVAIILGTVGLLLICFLVYCLYKFRQSLWQTVKQFIVIPEVERPPNRPEFQKNAVVNEENHYERIDYPQMNSVAALPPSPPPREIGSEELPLLGNSGHCGGAEARADQGSSMGPSKVYYGQFEGDADSSGSDDAYKEVTSAGDSAEDYDAYKKITSPGDAAEYEYHDGYRVLPDKVNTSGEQDDMATAGDQESNNGNIPMTDELENPDHSPVVTNSNSSSQADVRSSKEPTSGTSQTDSIIDSGAGSSTETLPSSGSSPHGSDSGLGRPTSKTFKKSASSISKGDVELQPIHNKEQCGDLQSLCPAEETC